VKTARTILFAATLLTLTAAQVFAASATKVEARLGAAQIYEGESVAYEVHVTNGKDGERPDLTAFKTDFDVAELGQSTYSSSFRMIINGQDMSPESGVTIGYRYQLTPKRIGTLTVPAPFIMDGGRKVSGRTFTLQIIAVEKQDVVLMEIQSSKTRLFPTLPFDLTLKIMVKPLPTDDRDPISPLDPPHLKITWKDVPTGLKSQGDIAEWLQRSVSNSGRGFRIEGISDNFGQLPAFNLFSGREKRTGLDGKEYNYFVYELKRRFIAQQLGSFEFGPATLKGEFVDGIAAGGRRFNVKPLFVVAPSKTVEVALQKAAPPNFNGCIGRFQFRAKTVAKDLRVGDPMTLTLEFERGADAGLLEDVTAPDLTTQPKLAADFTVVDKAPPGQTSGSVKSFSYTVRPKKAGVIIPPITVPVFDPLGDKYTDLVSNSIPLNVTDAPQLRADEIVSGAPISSGRSVGGRENGIFQNIADPSEISKPALNAPLYVELVAGLWLLYGFGFVALTLQRSRAGNTALQRRMQAQNYAAAQMAAARNALKANDGSAAALGVQRALTGLIGIWNGVPPEGMTSHDASATLAKAGASQASRDETVRLLDSIEASKYGAIAGLQALALVEAAEKLIPTLQKEMDAKK
jgi:hypothetical protein